MFRNRTGAGERLADRLAARGIDPDLVLGIPRGGLPVARPVADRLGAPLDVVAARKMRIPGTPEFAIGAATSDGNAWIDDETVERYDVDEDYVEAERRRAIRTVRDTVVTYRGDRPAPDVTGRTVVVVDDGVATGATTRACLRQVANAGADRVVLAVPVGPPDSLSALDDEADAVVTVEASTRFEGAGAVYGDLGEVSDEEATQCLGWVT